MHGCMLLDLWWEGKSEASDSFSVLCLLVVEPIRNIFFCYLLCDIVGFIRNIYAVIQMTKIYFSYTFGLCPQFLAHSSQNFWNFLSIESENKQTK